MAHVGRRRPSRSEVWNNTGEVECSPQQPIISVARPLGASWPASRGRPGAAVKVGRSESSSWSGATISSREATCWCFDDRRATAEGAGGGRRQLARRAPSARECRSGATAVPPSALSPVVKCESSACESVSLRVCGYAQSELAAIIACEAQEGWMSGHGALGVGEEG